MHLYGDEWFENNGHDLYDAIYFIESYLNKHHLTMSGKEKYGTYRDDLVKFYNGPFKRLIRWYQYRLYNKAFQLACKRWPLIQDELIQDLDYYHLIKPCRWGKVDGTKIHNRYWKHYDKE